VRYASVPRLAPESIHRNALQHLSTQALMSLLLILPMVFHAALLIVPGRLSRNILMFS